MRSLKRLHRDRVEVCIEIWGMILEGSLNSRDEVRNTLQEYYSERNIEPIRGRTKIDLYDKELITLYIVGKYGLGVDKEAQNLINNILQLERKCDIAYHRIMRGENPRMVMEELFHSHDPVLIFRVLRFVVTLNVLGFVPDDHVVKMLSYMTKAYPELSQRFFSFARFYVALKVAEAIALRRVKSPVEKEALKHSLCIKLGFEKATPSDEFIYDLARCIYKIEDEILSLLLPRAIRRAS
ncbi:MAG: hypothetical protein DRN15_08330 [Thermoprotei archaeon]|nr:MAG: hypothetical protein DRN15_08330 [Thermoprotei archaeon]RLF25443.1 MAG: hypothetical protein DRM97_01740 [Thermoprotei archaeon]